MATKTVTKIGSSWVLMALWAALVAVAASYLYSKQTIRKVSNLIEGIEHLVTLEFPRRE